MPGLGICPKCSKSAHHRNTYTSVFIAAVFGIPREWNRSRRPSTNESVKKMWCMYTEKSYMAMQKTVIMSFAGKGRKP